MLSNPWRFSSEYFDDDVEMVYYNYRHHDLIVGRWQSRDPIEGVSEYLFVNNRPSDCHDALGLIEYNFDTKKCKLDVVIKWELSFDEETPKPISISPFRVLLPVKWSDSEKIEWMNKAKSTVSDYFGSLRQRCMPPSNKCCKCKDGVAVSVSIKYVEGDADFNVVVIGYDGASIRSKVIHSKKHVDLDRSAPYWRGNDDMRDNPENPGEIQIVLIRTFPMPSTIP